MEHLGEEKAINEPKYVKIFNQAQHLAEFEAKMRNFVLNVTGNDKATAETEKYPMPSSLGAFLDVSSSVLAQIAEGLYDDLEKLKQTLI